MTIYFSKLQNFRIFHSFANSQGKEFSMHYPVKDYFEKIGDWGFFIPLYLFGINHSPNESNAPNKIVFTLKADLPSPLWKKLGLIAVICLLGYYKRKALIGLALGTVLSCLILWFSKSHQQKYQCIGSSLEKIITVTPKQEPQQNLEKLPSAPSNTSEIPPVAIDTKNLTQAKLNLLELSDTKEEKLQQRPSVERLDSSSNVESKCNLSKAELFFQGKLEQIKIENVDEFEITYGFNRQLPEDQFIEAIRGLKVVPYLYNLTNRPNIWDDSSCIFFGKDEEKWPLLIFYQKNPKSIFILCAREPNKAKIQQLLNNLLMSQLSNETIHNSFKQEDRWKAEYFLLGILQEYQKTKQFKVASFSDKFYIQYLENERKKLFFAALKTPPSSQTLYYNGLQKDAQRIAKALNHFSENTTDRQDRKVVHKGDSIAKMNGKIEACLIFIYNKCSEEKDATFAKEVIIQLNKLNDANTSNIPSPDSTEFCSLIRQEPYCVIANHFRSLAASMKQTL